MRVISVGGGLLLISGLFPFGGSVGCNPFPEREEPPVDCAVGDGYDIDIPFLEFENPGNNTWFPAVDGTGLVSCDHPKAVEGSETEVYEGLGGAPSRILCDGPRRAQATTSIESIPDGPRCGSEYAMRLTARRNNDWGCLFGDHVLARSSFDASEFDGISLWARAAPSTGKSITVLLNDKYTTNITSDDGSLNPAFESACVDEEPEIDGVRGAELAGQPGVTLPGYVPSKNACGNSHQLQLRVTEDWKWYRLPFDSFSQDPLPNRRFEGVDRASLRGMIIRVPKDTVFDLWIDDVAYYRERSE